MQKEKKSFTRVAYQRLHKELNNTHFITLVDADTTDVNINYIRKKW